MSTRPYKVVALGGTFDVFHEGHEQFLSIAFGVSDEVLIGITSDRFVKTLHKSHCVEPYDTRAGHVRRFLSSRRLTSRARVFPLSDPYGPAARRKRLDAIIVTPDSLSSARKLNKLRSSRGLLKLRIETAPLSVAKDGKTISSTRIRSGEIDQRGRLIDPHKP